MKVIPSPGKIVVKKHEAKLKGKIFLPPSRTKLYEIGEVVAVGRLDSFGYKGEEKTTETYKEGDLVLFQLPLPVAGAVSHAIKGEHHVFLNVLDVVGRLASDVISLKDFKIAGRYVLLTQDVRTPTKLIVLPDNAQEAQKEMMHYSVLQVGPDVTAELYKGQEVFPNRARINFINIESTEMVFIDQQFIEGVLAPD